jgi:diguanylate cyclase (GGDEF)-like protein/PAS domain S-box-containing protein
LLSSLRRVSFRGLICIALCLIGMAAVAIGATVLALRKDALRDAGNDAGNIAAVLAEQTSQSVQALDIITTDVVERFANNGRSDYEDHRNLMRGLGAHRFLAERLSRIPQTDFIALVDRNGMLVNTSRNWPAPATSVTDRDYFIDAVKNDGRRLFVSEIVRNRVSGERNIIFAKRITGPDGDFLGVVVTGIKLSYFQHIYRSITSLRNQSFLFLRSDGVVLVRYPDPDDRAGTRLPAEADWYRLVREGGGHYRAPGYFDGVPRLVAVRPLKDYPLVVNVAVTEISALANWNYRAMLIGIGALLTLLCSLVLIYALNHKFAEFAASRASLAEREANLAEKTHELEQANLRVDRAVNNMGHGLCMFNAKCELVVCNKTYLELYSFSPDKVKPGTTFREILEYRAINGSFFGDIDACMVGLVEKMRGGEKLDLVMDVGNGRTFCVTNYPTDDGGWVSTHEDITERVRDERELQRARNMLRAVVENIPEMLIVKDAKSGRYVFINRAGEELLGIPKEDLIGRVTHEVFSREQADRIVTRDRDALKSGHAVIQGNVIHSRDGRVRDVISKRVAIPGKDGKPEYLVSLIEDITERKRNETRIQHLAHHDPLTDLPNRAALNQRLSATLERAAQSGDKFAVLCIDLDRFKEVNDLYGHAAGDSVLLDISRRMQDAGAETFLSRAGGDEFMAICVDPGQPGAATTLAERLVAAVSGDIDCEGRKVRVGMSIGIAIYPDDGTDSVTLMRNADAALYRAKAEGRGAIRFFEAEMDRMLHDRRALQADLALAVSRNELQLYYQPQAQVAGQIVGFEALLRWDHPRRGFVPPGTFIPLAEESGLIDAIGEWVLREACREAASWRKPLQVAINLSPVQLRQGDLAALIHSVLIETGLSPDRLVIEITEGALMDDYSRSVSILRRIKALGVRIAMDDFGTGYSSLSYLQSFPFDKIKIDQTFISNLDRNAQSAAIVRAVLGLGRSLTLTTVAEGVENQQQLAILRREGCDEMQGYLIGRPQPISDYADIVGRKEKRTAISA